MKFMPFGKYRGTALTAVPIDYLQWLSSQPGIREPLLTAMKTELSHRMDREQPPPAPPPLNRCPNPDVAYEIISTGLRYLARKHHPDAGGDHETMVALNNCCDWLRTRSRDGWT